MLRLRCQRRRMRLAPIRFLLRSRTRHDAAGAVEAGVHVIHDDGPVVDVPHIGHVYVHHRAVIEESAASPLAAAETYTAVSEAVVNSAIEANMRPPIASVPAIEAAREAPVTRGPKHAHRRNYPCAGDPVVAAIVIPRPITRSPEIARTGTDGLRVYRQRRRTDPHRDPNPDLRRRCRRKRQHRKRQHQNSQNQPECQTTNGAFHFHYPSFGPVILAQDRNPA